MRSRGRAGNTWTGGVDREASAVEKLPAPGRNLHKPAQSLRGPLAVEIRPAASSLPCSRSSNIQMWRSGFTSNSRSWKWRRLPFIFERPGFPTTVPAYSSSCATFRDAGGRQGSTIIAAFSRSRRRRTTLVRRGQCAPVSNNWLDLDLVLVNAEDQCQADVGRARSQRLSWYDSDGSWSEGGNRPTAFPAGNRANIPDRGVWHWKPTFKTTATCGSMTSSSTFPSSLLLVLLYQPFCCGTADAGRSGLGRKSDLWALTVILRHRPLLLFALFAFDFLHWS